MAAQKVSTDFRIDVVDDAPDCLRLQVSGVIDEHADLEMLRSVSRPVVRLNLEGIRRINSFGVRAWMRAMNQIPEETQVIFELCPSPVIDQCNMVAGFLGHGAIESFYAPMICEDCDEHMDKLFLAADCLASGGHLPSTPCPSCKKDMEVDDLEEQYLLFLRDDDDL